MSDEAQDRIEAALDAATAAARQLAISLDRNATVEEVVQALEQVQQALLDEADRVRELSDLLNQLGNRTGGPQ